ncbi:T9SS type B sorting domain-containing protein [Algoriella sp.]|uniref:T9SS type B sorting domain-containing protein n=1 Tax=Algoriella sp. TaxID=1872434 RepID=UPI001B23723F|nr:T9SS type B sorting domain-containing protein [Algoriella sp.]MBO6213812.1 T9SS type B sorting domain-containing protein [Algoriella sp.]
MIECDANGDGTTGFDLQNFVDFIGSRATYITFHQSENDALSNINSIEENNYKFQGNSSLNSIWARIIGADGCITFTEITFKINSTSVIPKTETLCKTLINNEYYISLESLANLIGIGDIMVFNNLSDADLLLNQITNDILVNVDLNNKNLFIRKRNFEDCDDIIELKLNLLNPTIINIPKISALCPFEGSITFNIENNSDITSIIWKNEAGETIQTTNTISISEEGKYSVTVINKNNCSTTEYFEVTRSSPIEITYIIDKSKSLIINYGVLDSNNYLFSIDKGGTWHNGTTLSNLPLGSYELWIKENNENACIVYKNIIKNDLITNFFSPNGDGKNDKWIINGFEKYEWIDIQIFNRYGKLILKNKINASNVIWDGKVNGITQPNGSYWYILKASNNEQYDGYVILKTK